MVAQIAAADGRAQATSRGPIMHELKCWPKFFRPIALGKKRHDLRRATDRQFMVGDCLLLREFDPDIGAYTGQTQRVEITYITSAEMPCALSDQALNPDFCILSITPIENS
jgi:hypothetical protein